MDTGASITLLTPEASRDLNLTETQAPEVIITYGQGARGASDRRINLGGTPGYVVDGLQTSLFSPNQLIDSGSYLLLNREGGHIGNSAGEGTIPIARSDGGWTVWLQDVENYTYEDNEILARRAADSGYRAGTAGRSSINQLVSSSGDSVSSARAANLGSSSGTSTHVRGERPIPAWMAANNIINEQFRKTSVCPPGGNVIAATTSAESSFRPAPASRSIREREPVSSDEQIYCRTVKLTGKAVLSRYIDLHERGHISPRLMEQAVLGENPAWRNSGLTAGQVRRCSKLWQCPLCVLAKRNKKPIPVNVPDPNDFDRNKSALNSKNAEPGEIISMDPSGLISPACRGGQRQFLLFKDVCTGYDHAVVTHNQDLVTVKEAISFVFDWYTRKGCKPKLLRVDSAKHLISDELDSWLFKEWGAQIQNSIPYMHWQNAVERDVQTVVNGASALLHGQKWLKADCWDLALWHFIDLRNRTPNARSSKSPLYRITKEVLDFSTSFLFTFGDLLAVALPGDSHQREWKFDMKNELGIYCGQPLEKRGSLVYWPYTHQTSIRFHCHKIVVTDVQFQHYYSSRARMRDGPTTLQAVEGAMHDFGKAVELDPVACEEWHRSLNPLRSSLSDPDQSELENSSMDRLSTESLNMPRMRLRSAAQREHVLVADVQPATYGEYIEEFGGYMFEQYNAASAKVTVGKALKSPEADAWIQAIIVEIRQLIEGGTLEATDDANISGIYKIIHSTMQLKQKLHQDLSLDKFKARLCACGNELFGAIAETFSPTVGALAYATVHQIAIIDRMHRCTVDTVGAYLHQSYPEELLPIYIVLPANVAEACGLDPAIKYRVRKYLYGLPDSGLAYYKAYASHLISKGYERSMSDPCLFIKLDGRTRTYVFTHVDDTFVCSTRKEELKIFADAMREKFEITVCDNVEEYLGIKMTELVNGDVRLTQPKLLKTMSEEHAEELSSLPRIGVPVPVRNYDAEAIANSESMEQAEYLHLLGGLIYMTKSRPDIMTAVSFAATFSARPTRGAYNELLRCLLYLTLTKDEGLLLKGGQQDRDLQLTCYVDASYLTHRDSKSHTGYCLSFGSIGTFYAKSGKQPLVATSSTHAEMRALYSLVIDVIYVINLCTELSRPVVLPCIILEDNQPVLDITTEINSRAKRCKHFLMLVHFVKEQVISGLIKLAKVDTSGNVADVLTKVVTGNEFTKKAQLLLGTAN